MNYTVEPELIASILVAVLIVNTVLYRGMPSVRTIAFRISLGVSFVAILVNVFSVYAIQWIDRIPLWLAVGVNEAYFILTPLMVTSILCTTIVTLFENRYQDPRFKLFLRLTVCVYLLYLPIVVANLWTGWLFRFDENLLYVRGPFNASGTGYLAVCLAICLLCYRLERRRVGGSFRLILYTMVGCAVVFAVFQITAPQTILSGTLAAMSLLVLFIYGQQQQVQTDHLTELSNREMFYETLERFAQRKQRFYVMVISLRGYKDVNNRFGQRKSDQLLRAVAAYLAGLRRNAVACRFSGVEFALIVPNVPESEYEALFFAVRERFRQPWITDGCRIRLQAALADAAYPEHAGNVNDLVLSLEYAVRQAKRAADGAPVRFSKQLRNELGRRNYVISQLEPALEAGRLFLHFQPVHDLSRGRAVGAEVLLRLKDEAGMTVSPSEFIPLAEETGILSRISWFVFERACAFLAGHRDCGIEWLSVNVSAQDFEQAEILLRLHEILNRYQVPPGMLKLEITESMLVKNIEAAREKMRLLHEMGMGVCLDDFGTGYSNLYNVMSLPFDYIKIDKRFVDEVVFDPYAGALLETVVRGIRATKARTVVEGVETAEQDAAVRRLGVDCIQGFLYARPMEGDGFARFMADGGR